jgi:hypothetical protein
MQVGVCAVQQSQSYQVHMAQVIILDYLSRCCAAAGAAIPHEVDGPFSWL